MAVFVFEVQEDPNDSSKSTSGQTLSTLFHLAGASGTTGADTFDAATDLSTTSKALMTKVGRGAYVGLGDGDDTATGTAYGDNFEMGTGKNYVDGGANGGTTPWGSKAMDAVVVRVADQTAADAVTVTSLAAGAGDDGTAFSNGYKLKITSGSTVNYVKNVELATVVLDNGTFVRNIQLATNVNEIQMHGTDPTKTAWGDPVANQFHLAWANGTQFSDTFDAATDVSAATQTVMANTGRGMFIGLGGGDDTATGTAYGDNFDMGSGTNYVDGGANSGTTPWGSRAMDTLDLYVANQAAANAVTVTALSAGAGTDGDAFTAGYKFKVVAGTDVNYVKNIEGINIQIWNDANSNGQKDWGTEISQGRFINLTTNVNEIQMHGTDPTKTAWGDPVANQFHLAWANGTEYADTFNAATDVSSATQTVMTNNSRGMFIGLGGGNDTATGTGFGDNFDMGSGTNYVDGGANAGTTPWGSRAMDTLDLFVADQAAANAITVTALAAGAGADGDAFTAGYKLKVVSGSDINYVKNVEAINVRIWNDANSNGQKDWGTEVTQGRFVNLTTNVNEIQMHGTDPTKTASGDPVANSFHLAWANGTEFADTFTASTDVSSATQTVMANNSRGMFIGLGAGNDTATGTGFGDNFDMGAGTNYVDGGANAGTTPWGSRAMDTLDLFVADQAAANAITVTALAAGTGADGDAFTAGYKLKVVSGSDINYVKNVEAINVRIWNDANSNGQKDWGTEVTQGRFINLTTNVNEIQMHGTDPTKTASGDPVANSFHLAWANGTEFADTFTAAIGVSSATQTVMANNSRGMFIGLGAGNDTATGTAYGDNFDMGSGTNFVDGGANAGTTPWGSRAMDTLDLFVANQAAANAVTVTALTAGAGADGNAFAAGYKLKVVSGSEINYLKNVEGVGIQIWNDANGNGQKDWGTEVSHGRFINLTTHVNEIQMHGTDPTKTASGDPVANSFHLAWANGTEFADTFTAAIGVSSATQTVMANNSRGMFIGLGAGNDTATGTAYGDNFDMGSGTNYVDGGANSGTTPWGARAMDTLDLYVANQAAANAVTVAALASGSGTDGDAFTAGYKFKVVAGTEINYVKNVEAINVQIWNDANSNGQKDWGTEISQGRFINLTTNVNEIQMHGTDPTKTASGDPVANSFHLAWANGTEYADTFNAASDVSAATQTVMTNTGRGMFIGLGGGDDTATGTGFGDNFEMGSGTNYVDGGANAGTTPWGAKATDVLDLYVTNQTAANAVTVTALAAGAGADGDAFTAGYKFKVVAGSDVHYVKNIEGVGVQIWNDADTDGQKDWATEVSHGRFINLTTNVNEIQMHGTDPTKTASGDPVANSFHLAWANGTDYADNFVADNELSSATKTVMTNVGRGMFIGLGGGNDTATGTAYGDNFDMGTGTNFVDGGADGGSTPWGGAAMDTLDLYVADAAAANAVTVTTLAAGAGADGDAFTAGYKFKVVSGSQVNYLKNVETVNIQIWNDANSNGQKEWATEVTPGARFINLGLNVNEVLVDPNDNTKNTFGQPLANQSHMAWASGTAWDDSFSVAADVSATTRGIMDTYQRGVSVELGTGNDTAVGSAYGDNFVMGAGTDFVDGGTQLGTLSNGSGAARDTLDIYVGSQAEHDALNLTVLDANATGADAAAFGQGYTGKVTAGTNTTYIKNIEAISVQLWNDADADGQRDFPGEVTSLSFTNLVPTVFENTGNLSTQFQVGSVNGTEFDDTLNLAAGSALISTNLANNMSTFGRGLFIQAGEGNDTIVGTAYGDGINGGSGVNYIDGGTSIGSTPNSVNPPRDQVNLIVGNNTDASNVVLTVIAGATGLTGADLAAQQAGYRYKVVSAATNETDYLKNVETLNIQVWTDLNGNGNNDFGGELTTYRTRALGNTVTDNVPSTTNQTPALGFVFGTQFKDTINANNMFAALGKTFDAANPFGSFIFALGGSDTVTATAGTDFVVATHTSGTTPASGSHLIDGGADAGYYHYVSGTPVISGDQYRMLEQRTNAEVPNTALANGGLTVSDFQTSKYRMVDLTQWTGFATTGLDQMPGSAASELTNIISNSALSSADVTSIATVAAQLGLTAAGGGGGYTMAMIKYAADGTTLLGVDFLKDVETIQLGLWFDGNRNDVANGGATPETVVYATYTVKQDSYTLAEAHKTWLDLPLNGVTQSFAGILNGKSFSETLDASSLTAPGYFAAGTGFRIGDLSGDDTVIGSGGNDLFGLGAGNDTVNGGAGTDTAAIFWAPGANKGAASLTSTKTLNGGITTITVSQTNSDGVMDLLTLVNNGTDSQWTLTTAGTGADAYVRPSGTTTAAIGTDVLTNVESVAIYLQAAATGTTTGTLAGTTPLEIQLVGVVI